MRNNYVLKKIHILQFILKKIVSLQKFVRGVAQLASALAWGARGRKFESSYPDNFKDA